MQIPFQRLSVYADEYRGFCEVSLMSGPISRWLKKGKSFAELKVWIKKNHDLALTFGDEGFGLEAEPNPRGRIPMAISHRPRETCKKDLYI